MKFDRIVLDSNIYISLTLNQRLDKLVEWSKDYKVTIYTCPELIAELKTVMMRQAIKRNLTESISVYLRFINSVTEIKPIDLSFDRAPDVKDNYLFDLAYTTKSHYIVTGDKPLLNMKQVNRIKLVSLGEWEKLLDKA